MRLFFLCTFLLTFAYADKYDFREGMFAYRAGNYKKAAVFFKKSIAEDDENNAHYMLGRMYLEGNGIKKDPKKAVLLLDKAFDRGNIPAGCYLSEAYMITRINLSYVLWGFVEGLRLNIPQCKKVYKDYQTYNFFKK